MLIEEEELFGSLNSKNYLGCTPLRLAATGNTKTLFTLNGCVCVKLKNWFYGNKWWCSYLSFAFDGKDQRKAQTLLSFGVKWNCSESEINGIHFFLKYDKILFYSAGHEDCVRYLIEQGADVNVSDIKAQTALYVAVKNKHLNCVKLLLKVNQTPHLSLSFNLHKWTKPVFVVR